jgi:signal transduction histidine kinase/CheY-like chemotaxis protein
LSILLVEDNPAEARLLSENLKAARSRFLYTLTCAQRLDEALRLLGEGGFDALLLDLSLPDSSGIQTVDIVRANFPLIPIVVLTGNDDETVSLEAVSRGAQDYLVKGQTDPKTLLRSLHYAMERKKNEEAVIGVNERLEQEVFARTAELREANERLKREILEKASAEAALTKRQAALESIYAIETSFSVSLETTYDQTVVTVANILGVPYAVAGEIEKRRVKVVSQFLNGTITRARHVSIASHPCGIVFRDKKICQFSGDLKAMFPEQMGMQSEKFESYVCVPILNKENEIKGMICGMDVRQRTFEESEVHLIEIFARYIGHELEHVAMEEQLRSANEMNLLGRLASGVAHEVRNPLNGILAISEALFQDLGNNPEYLPYLEHIKSQVHRLSALMNDLLDLGKPILQIELKQQSLEGIVRNVIESFKQFSRYKHRDVELVLNASIEGQYVRANIIKMQQVFFNLLENACDHSPENSKILLEVAEPEDRFAVLRVVDRGSGVMPELMARVFEPFFTTRKGGTGLGLSIVKHIVEIHGGAIVLSNNTDAPGLTVEIRLPLAMEPVEVGDKLP